MSWTEQSTIETSWAEPGAIDTTPDVLYNTILAYNIDYVTYNGDYVLEETDWTPSSSIETSWSS